jgi:hypothetical protein
MIGSVTSAGDKRPKHSTQESARYGPHLGLEVRARGVQSYSIGGSGRERLLLISADLVGWPSVVVEVGKYCRDRFVDQAGRDPADLIHRDRRPCPDRQGCAPRRRFASFLARPSAAP